MSDEQREANKTRMAQHYIEQYRSRAESSFAAPTLLGDGQTSENMTEEQAMAECVGMRSAENEIARLSQDNERLINGVLRAAIECNCRAEHGADGAEHLLAIEKMLRSVVT